MVSAHAILVGVPVPKNKAVEMEDLSKTVLRNMTDERTSEILSTPEGKWVLETLLRHHPWQTFVTLTTSTIATPERMKKIIFKTFALRRSTKGCKYFWVLEPFKSRAGVHAHLLVKDMPPFPSWRRTFDWYFNTKEYGRFQSLPIRGSRLFTVAAYCTKYCLKEMKDGEFGFSTTITGAHHHDSGNRITGPKKKGSKARSWSGDSLIRMKADWLASRHHRKQRNIYRPEGCSLLNGWDKLRIQNQGDAEWNLMLETARLEMESNL